MVFKSQMHLFRVEAQCPNLPLKEDTTTAIDVFEYGPIPNNEILCLPWFQCLFNSVESSLVQNASRVEQEWLADFNK